MHSQKDWLNPSIEIRPSHSGKGMFAKNPIKKGEAILIWKSGYTSDRNLAQKEEQNGKLVMQWDTNLWSIEEQGDDDSYFINHSCEPNVWMNDAYTLIAKKNIKRDEELTADYALWEADEQYISEWSCLCNSKHCRGKITGKDYLLPAVQKAYKNHFSPLINKRIQAQ